MAGDTFRTPFTPRFTEALALACDLHRAQTRKGTQIPYVAHLLGVASIAIEHGADEDEAIAAVLHDAVEGHGGGTAARISGLFGERVASIVLACGEEALTPMPWKERQKDYLARLERANGSVRLVSASETLQSAREILADYRALGGAVWGRFAGGKEGTLWCYRAMIESFRRRAGGALVEELARVVADIDAMAERRAAARARAEATPDVATRKSGHGPAALRA